MAIITKTTTQPVMVTIFSPLFPTLSISPGVIMWFSDSHLEGTEGENEKVVALEEITCPCLLWSVTYLVREWQGVNVPLLQSEHPLSVEAVPAKPQIYTVLYLQVILWRSVCYDLIWVIISFWYKKKSETSKSISLFFLSCERMSECSFRLKSNHRRRISFYWTEHWTWPTDYFIQLIFTVTFTLIAVLLFSNCFSHSLCFFSSGLLWAVCL